MRIIGQIIDKGTIEVNSAAIADCGRGLALFVAFTKGDDMDKLTKMAAKVVAIRVFPDAEGKTNLAIGDVGGTLLVIPNFTLYASFKGMRRPSLSAALPPTEAETLFRQFVGILKSTYANIGQGVFGADMEIELTNQGPFTFILDSNELWGPNT